MITALGKKRFQETIDFLRTVPPKKFNYRYFVVDGGKPPLEALAAGNEECGTTGCVLGWLPAKFPQDWEWVHQNDQNRSQLPEYQIVPRLRGTKSWTDSFDNATEFFGLNSTYESPFEEQLPIAHYLFDPVENELESYASPTTVADFLQKWLNEEPVGP